MLISTLVGRIFYSFFFPFDQLAAKKQVDVRRQTMLILDLVSNTQDAIQQSVLAAYCQGKCWTIETWHRFRISSRVYIAQLGKWWLITADDIALVVGKQLVVVVGFCWL